MYFAVYNMRALTDIPSSVSAFYNRLDDLYKFLDGISRPLSTINAIPAVSIYRLDNNNEAMFLRMVINYTPNSHD